MGLLMAKTLTLPSTLTLENVEGIDLDDAVSGEISDIYCASHGGEPVVLKHLRALRFVRPMPGAVQVKQDIPSARLGH